MLRHMPSWTLKVRKMILMTTPWMDGFVIRWTSARKSGALQKRRWSQAFKTTIQWKVLFVINLKTLRRCGAPEKLKQARL